MCQHISIMSAETAQLVYKQPILPYYEYNHCVIDSCNEDDLYKFGKSETMRIINKIYDPQEPFMKFILQLTGMKRLKVIKENQGVYG